MKFTFTQKFPDAAQRRDEAARIRAKYPDRIPVIAECDPKSKAAIGALTRTRFLVPNDLTMGQFAYVIRKRMALPPEKAVFLLIAGRVLAPTAMLMSQAYMEHKDADDDFLYVAVSGENTFG